MRRCLRGVKLPASIPLDQMKFPVEFFDDLSIAEHGPWRVRERWYEQRKRSLVLAALPRSHYINGLDLGCGVGVLSAQMAARCRCDRLTAVDASGAAIALARFYLSEQRNVALQHVAIPAQWPAGRFDLIVLSEAGYYLDRQSLSAVADRISESLDADGTLLLCHWRHPVDGAELSALAIHAALARRAHLSRLSRVDDEDFLLDVFERNPRSIAAREGIV